MSALSDLLVEANRVRSMTTRKRAEKIDNRLHFATLAQYQRGDHPAEPDEEVLQALAEAYDLPLARVQQAARVQVGAGPWSPPAEVTRLTKRQQDAISELIVAIAKGGSIDGRQPEAQKRMKDGGADGKSEDGGGPPDPGEASDGVIGYGRPIRRKTSKEA